MTYKTVGELMEFLKKFDTKTPIFFKKVEHYMISEVTGDSEVIMSSLSAQEETQYWDGNKKRKEPIDAIVFEEGY